MGTYIIGLVLSLAIILISCELFTNGAEWLGKLLKLGDGVVGSILSAVGTCLPETLIPVIAIFSPGKKEDSINVGVGAILGAPFMLSTLAFFVTGMSVLIFSGRRKTGVKISANNEIVKRDIIFFIIAYGLGISASFTKAVHLKGAIALFLFALYIIYIVLTIKRDEHSGRKVDRLYLKEYLNLPENGITVVVQIVLALLGIVFGAEIFVGNISDISHVLSIPAITLSLILTPIATELPEKFNSIIWIARNKDTLALGNITGAMVFQSCIPVAVGIAATPWELDKKSILSAVIAIFSAMVTYFSVTIKKKLTPLPLTAGGAFYMLFIIILYSVYQI